MAGGIHCCPNFLFIFPEQSLFCGEGVYTNTCIVYELALLPNNNFYTNRELCEVLTEYLSLGRRTGGEWRIRDIGQNDVQSHFETGSSSSHSYCHILFLIAFHEEAFIRNIIIQSLYSLITICIKIIIIFNNLE